MDNAMNQATLLEMFFGKEKPRRVWFSDGTKMDARSEEGGVYGNDHPKAGEYKRPYFIDAVMFNSKDPDSKDVTTREASERDFEKHRKEYEFYKERRHLIPIDKLPKIKTSELELCRHIGVHSIQGLLNFDIANFDELRVCKEIAAQYMAFINNEKPRIKLGVAA